MSTTSAGPRYSLWLLPDEDATLKFSELIATLSHRYHGPRFNPHVTLLGWLMGAEAALMQSTAALAQELQVLALRPQELAGEAYYFRCFYARLERSVELLAAHERASAVFGAGYASDYLPHLSLVYGQLDGAKKTRLRAELTAQLPTSFTADRLQLVHIEVAVADWHAVATHPLRPTP